MKRPALAILVPLVAALISGVSTLLLYPFVHFARPGALWFLVVLVFVAGLWAWKAQRRLWLADQLMHPAAVQRLIGTWCPRRASIRFSMVGFASYCLIIASAQPQWGEQTRRIQREGIDIVIVLDASRSMLAEDAAPDRLRAATEELDRLLTTLDGDRVGLVVFAGMAFAQSPLTSDYGAIRLYLSRINPDAIPSQGTALGRAITEAHRLLVGGGNPEFRRAPNQLIIVLSDGEDHETNPVQAASFALEDGIRVFTVGIGTSTGGRIPLRDARGNFSGYLTDRQGNVVNTHLEDGQLQEIAAAGGGSYHRHSGTGTSAAFLASEIDRFDQAALSSILRAHYIDRGHIFLWPALLLMFLAMMIDERPRNRRSGQWLNILLVLLLVLPTSGCLDFKHQDPQVRRAVNYAEAGEFEAALAEIERANQDAKAQHAFHFNRGKMQEAVGAFEEAQADYLSALGAPGESLRNAALIGLGNALFYQGDYAGASERFRRALSVDPSNETARRNLEIAHRHLFPACSALEGSLEPNNDRDQASPLPADSFQGEWADFYADNAPTADSETSPKHVLCGLNDDWYSLPVQGGERVDLKVNFQRLREDDGGPPLPTHIVPTAVRIALVDRYGEIRAVDQGLPTTGAALEKIAAVKFRRQMEGLLIDAGRAPYYLQVSADAGMEYHYEISATITPPCSALEDDFEPNDIPELAWTIPNGEHQARICVDNEDWFQIDVAPDEHVFVDLQATPTKDQPDPRLRTSFLAGTDAKPVFQKQADAGRITWASGLTTQKQSMRWGIASQDQVEGPYTMDVYHFPSCPTGNDRFEPNDRPSTATSLTPEQTELRHLRLCPQDEDWFVMQLPEQDENAGPDDDEHAEREPQLFSALAEFTEEHRAVVIELWDPRTGQRLAVSEPVEQTDYQIGDQPHAVVAVTQLPEHADAVVIRVIGQEGFYHLRFPDTQAPQSSDENSEGDSSDQENEADQGAQDGQSNSDGEESDANDDASPEDDEPEPGQEEPSAPPEAEDDEQAQRNALMQLLESLGDDGTNLQLMQALEREPPPRMHNEW